MSTSVKQQVTTAIIDIKDKTKIKEKEILPGTELERGLIDLKPNNLINGLQEINIEIDKDFKTIT